MQDQNTFSTVDTRRALTVSSSEEVRNMANDMQLVAALTNVLNATLEIAATPPKSMPELSASIINKSLSYAQLSDSYSGKQTFQATAFAVGTSMKTLELLGLAKMSPVQAGIKVTLVTAEKIVMAAGLGQIDKCKVAISSLAITSGSSAFTCAISGGLLCVVGAVAIAADAFSVYGQCYGK